MERGRGEGGERRGGVGSIGARGTKKEARTMKRGRVEGGERRCGVGLIGAQVAKGVMERGRGEDSTEEGAAAPHRRRQRKMA